MASEYPNKMANHSSRKVTTNFSIDEAVDHPAAPPGANRVQLELWRRVFSHRRRQIQTLSPMNFLSYVNDIALDLKASKIAQDGGGLVNGHYSSCLIYQHPSPSCTAFDVTCHISALFYCSIDERLSADERRYGLDAVKRAFTSLDNALKDQDLGVGVNSNNIDDVSKSHEGNDDGAGSVQDEMVDETVNEPDIVVIESDAEDDSTFQNSGKKGTNCMPSAINQSVQTCGSLNNKCVPGSISNNTQKDDKIHAPLRNKSIPSENLSSSESKQKELGSLHEGKDRKSGDTRMRKDHLDAHNAKKNQSHHPTNNPQEKRTPSNTSGNQGEGKQPQNKRQRRELSHMADETISDNETMNQTLDDTINKAVGETPNEPDIVEVDSDAENDSTSQNAYNKSTDDMSSAKENKNVLENVDPTQMGSSMTDSTSKSNKNKGTVETFDEEEQNVPIERNGQPNYTVANSTSCSKNRKGTLEKTTSPQKSTVQKGMSPPDKEQETSPSPPETPFAALPPPLPHSCMQHMTFLSDNHTPSLASSSLHPRNSCVLTFDAGFSFDGSGSCLDDKEFIDVRHRLERWDPYWRIVKEFGRREVSAADHVSKRQKTMASTRTTSCVSTLNFATENIPMSCAMVTVDLTREGTKANAHKKFNLNPVTWGVKWGQTTTTYRTGDRRLLLRMLPLKRTDKDKKRSDTHIWPIGTFLQLSQSTMQQVLPVSQRRQQSHDPRLWKGLCYPLDMTPFFRSASSSFSIKICTREVIEKAVTPRYKIGTRVSKQFEDDAGELRPFAGTVKRYDADVELYHILYEDGDSEDLTHEEVANFVENNGVEEKNSLLGSYGIHLAVCEYIEPDCLYNQIMDNLQKISLESAQRMAAKYLENQTINIDSDDEDGKSSRSSSLTFSLLCPISKMAIVMPARGKHCKHMQCFDLKSFLHSNKHVSGGRWRCGCCEEFISVRDLVICGLFEAMLHDHKDKVSGARDKVSVKSDGTWCLKEENKLRYASKSRGLGANGGGRSTDVRNQEKDHVQQKRPLSQPEVIDLL